MNIKMVVFGVVFSVIALLGVFGYWFINQQNKIIFVSDVAGYKVIKAGTEDLEDFLREVNFWGKDRVILRKREIYGQTVTAKKLVVHVNQEKYVHGAYVDGNKKVIYSNKEEYEKGVLHLFVGIESGYWVDTKRLAELIKMEVLSAVYELTEPENYFKTDKMRDILMAKADKIYVTIEKKR